MNLYLLILGFLVHLVFFYSIFDIYFTSPLVHGMTPQKVLISPPAKRLVLFVADGLRADKLFELDEHGATRAPFLRSKMLKDGAWGVSHTRVPTESRPGHVALIAGFYEDVSAIAKGWKENPVEFDSVFNESLQTWSWGSPDILPMFSKGASGDHVNTEMYPGHNEDFAGADLSQLDTWVFDRAQEFLKSAKSKSEVWKHLSGDKIIFFLHLLGLDSNGHAHKPHSEIYLENIKVIDDGIGKIVESVESTFGNDGRTAYVFTADHGMTDWGSHGAGEPSETFTPLIAWGSGIRSARHTTLGLSKISPTGWDVSHVQRSDVNQADLCPLMASLIGVPIPLQSVGIVPLDYLNTDDEFKADCIYTNARQILQQFEIKRHLKLNTTFSVLYRPFKELSPVIQADELRTIQQYIREQNYEKAIQRSHRLIKLGLDGLAYYHNYDRLFLGVSIASGFVGWMTYIITLIIQNHTHLLIEAMQSNTNQESTKRIQIAFLSLGSLVAVFLLLQSQRWTYYVYVELAIWLWYKVFVRAHVLKDALKYAMDHGLLLKTALSTVVAFASLELFVLSFFYRELLTIGLIAMAMWTMSTSLARTHWKVNVCWIPSCLLVSIFPCLPVIGRMPSYHLVYSAGALAAVIAVVSVVFRSTLTSEGTKKQSHSAYLTLLQIVLIVTSVFVAWSTVGSRERSRGLPLVNQCISWSLLASAFVVPLLSSRVISSRLIAIFLAFLPSYLLLSTSHEGFFYIMLCLLMLCWLRMESCLMVTSDQQSVDYIEFAEQSLIFPTHRKLVPGDLRIAYFFIFFLLSAFFGTGNIASLNSFDVSSIFCFVTVFSPFIMGSLLLWKVLIPFLLVTCTFNGIHVAANVPTQSLLLVVLLMSDFMALQFFFLVRDYGSWLDIGTSISHYVIVMATILFLFFMLMLSKFFTNFSLGRRNKSHEL